MIDGKIRPVEEIGEGLPVDTEQLLGAYQREVKL
jgi:hypothetical protein